MTGQIISLADRMAKSGNSAFKGAVQPKTAGVPSPKEADLAQAWLQQFHSALMQTGLYSDYATAMGETVFGMALTRSSAGARGCNDPSVWMMFEYKHGAWNFHYRGAFIDGYKDINALALAAYRVISNVENRPLMPILPILEHRRLA